MAYAIYREDPAIILGHSMGLFVYVRNLMPAAKAERVEVKRLRREAAAHADAGSSLRGGHRLDPAHRETTTAD